MKYKKSTGDWFWQIDEKGNKIEFNKKNSPGRYAEMQEWLKIEGNEIEPQYTAEESAEKEAEEAENAIANTNSEARSYLEKTDKWVTRHRDQIDDGHETSLTNIQFKKLLSKRQIARDRITDSEPIDLD